MKSQQSIRRELSRTERALRRIYLTDEKGRKRELYGVQQALSWVLGRDVMPPARAATLGEEKK